MCNSIGRYDIYIGADDRSENVITDLEVGTAISEPDTEDASAPSEASGKQRS